MLAGLLWFVLLLDFLGAINLQFSMILPAINCIAIPFGVAFLLRATFKDYLVAALLIIVTSVAIVTLVINPVGLNLFHSQSPSYSVIRIFYSNPYSPVSNAFCGEYLVSRARSPEPVQGFLLCDNPVANTLVVLPPAFALCVFSMWFSLWVRKKLSATMVAE